MVVAAHGTRPVEESLPALLPALEQSRSEFWGDLEERARSAGLHTEDVRSLVPEEDLLLLALRVSDYWATLALRWAAETDLTPDLQKALASLAEKGATQRLRHDAQHVLAGHRPKG